MELYLIVERNVGYYEEPDSFNIRGILTSPEKIIDLNLSSKLDITDLTIFTIKEEDLDKNIYANISSYYAYGEDLKNHSYHDFLKEHKIEIPIKKTNKNLK